MRWIDEKRKRDEARTSSLLLETQVKYREYKAARIPEKVIPRLKTQACSTSKAPKSLKAFLAKENQGLRVIEMSMVSQPTARAKTPKYLRKDAASSLMV